MCAEKSEGASYGIEALALGGLTDPGLLLAQMRSAGSAEQCPVLRVKLKTYTRTEFFSV